MRRIMLPAMPENCQQCGRKLDGRMIDNPYGVWSTPVLNGAVGRWTCTYCNMLQSGDDPAARLPQRCEARKQLNRWIAQEGK